LASSLTLACLLEVGHPAKNTILEFLEFTLDKCVFKLLRDFAVEDFFSYKLLNARKQRTFYMTSYLQGLWKYGKAKEAVESAKAGLTPLERE
jgi:hypothetical protein